MKYALLFFGLFVFGCAVAQKSEELFEKDFAQVSNVYKLNIAPYLEKLIEAQYEALPQNSPDSVVMIRRILLKSRLVYFDMIFEFAMEESHRVLSANLSSTYQTKDRIRIINLITEALQKKMISIDYTYYKKCKDEAEKLP